MKKRILSVLLGCSLLFGTVFANAVSIEFENLEQSDKSISTDVGDATITYEELEEATAEENIIQDIDLEQNEKTLDSPLATEISEIEEAKIEPKMVESDLDIQNYAFTSTVKDRGGNVVSNATYNQMIKNIEDTVESANWKQEKSGKILTNVPVTNWTRSSNCVSFTRKNASGGLAEWNWSTVKSLNKEFTQPEQVWDSARNENHNSNVLKGQITAYNNVLYDGTTWTAPNGRFIEGMVIEDLYKYEGTFKIDKTYDMSNLYFTLSTVASDRIIYLNDNIYIFIYPTCLKKSISNNASSPYYFINFLCFWTGTIATVTDVKTFYGIPAETAYQDLNRFSDLKSYEKALNFTGWNLNANKDNVGNTIYNSYLLAKNNPNYDGEYTITVIAGDIADRGGMYRPILFMEYKDSVITYLGNGATGGSTQNQTKTYGTDLYISPNGYIKEGYSFAEWNTKADGSGESYYPNDTFKREDGLRLFAQWQVNQYPATYIDVDSNGNEIGRTTKMVDYGTSVRGAEIGNDTSDNVFYNQYRYVSDTSATVTTEGAVVYRVFEFCETEAMVNLQWNDNNNADGFRPSKYKLKLKQNGKVIDEVELPSDETNYTFPNLPKYDSNGNVYKYSFDVDASNRYQIDFDEDGNLIVEDYLPANFSVIIPKTIVMDGGTGNADYNVLVNGTFYYNDTLTVIPESSLILTDRSKISSMQADVLQQKTTFMKEDGVASGTTATGSISADRKLFAGSWSGNFNFNISFKMQN